MFNDASFWLMFVAPGAQLSLSMTSLWGRNDTAPGKVGDEDGDGDGGGDEEIEQQFNGNGKVLISLAGSGNCLSMVLWL